MTDVRPPDPATEIRMTTLHATRGANYWSRRPVTRMDLLVGAYDDLSSAQLPGVAESLARALPGLIEHRCSIGERGGFLTRLRRGTYAPHIIEHVALELQNMIGHDVGYGRTRAGDQPGQYTLVFEHEHEGVGLRAAALALETVQRAFAGTLESVDHAVAELRAIAMTPDVPAVRQHVLCGITGGSLRAETREEMARRQCRSTDLVIDVSPAYMLQAGLPYSRSEMAVILNAEVTDVPERYREPERARRLVATVIDAVPRGGLVIVPAKEWEVQDAARDAGCQVGIFSAHDDVTVKDRKVARTTAFATDGRIVIEHLGEQSDAGELTRETPAEAQVAGALAMFALRGTEPVPGHAGETDPTSPATAAADAA